MLHVALHGGGAGELSMALGAEGFRSGAGLLALVAQQVAEGGELAAVAAVVEALGFGPRVEDARHHGAGLRAGRR